MWYYAINNERKGPVPQETLFLLIRAGTLDANTLVWTAGMQDWKRLNDIPTLSACLTQSTNEQIPKIQSDTSAEAKPLDIDSQPITPIRPVNSAAASDATQQATVLACSVCGKHLEPSEALQYHGETYCQECSKNHLRSLQTLPENIYASIEPASMWLRFAAYIIDNVITSAVGQIFGILFGTGSAFLPLLASSGGHRPPPTPAMDIVTTIIFTLVIVLIFFLYESIFLCTCGGTPGKLILGLRVSDENGAPLSFGRACLRTIVKNITGGACFLLYIIPFVNSDNKALHDMAAHTYVVSKK